MLKVCIANVLIVCVDRVYCCGIGGGGGGAGEGECTSAVVYYPLVVPATPDPSPDISLDTTETLGTTRIGGGGSIGGRGGD